MDWFRKMKEEAVIQMGILAETPVENTEDGMCSALHRVFEHGSYKDGAKAMMIVAHWMWANCEETYHAQSPAAK